MRSFLLFCTIAHVSAFSGNFWGSPNMQPELRNSNNQRTGEESPSALMISKRGRPKGPVRTIEQKPPMNREIKYDTLRVTTPNPKGKDDSLGIMSKAEALQKAREMGNLDVILINENSDPPVCKIADYSKYRYQKEKKAKELKKNAKATEVKEVKMSYKIDVHDYGVRKKAAAKFLNQGNRVKCTVMFKGREIQHDKLGYELLDRLAADLEDLCLMEGKPKREGRNLSCFITPKPSVVKAINDKKRATEKEARKKKEASRVAMEEKKTSKTVVVEELKETETELSLDELLEGVKDDDDDVDTIDELLGGDGVTDDLFA